MYVCMKGGVCGRPMAAKVKGCLLQRSGQAVLQGADTTGKALSVVKAQHRKKRTS